MHLRRLQLEFSENERSKIGQIGQKSVKIGQKYANLPILPGFFAALEIVRMGPIWAWAVYLLVSLCGVVISSVGATALPNLGLHCIIHIYIDDLTLV